MTAAAPPETGRDAPRRVGRRASSTSRRDSHRPFVVRVTGPGRNVGKTTLASALIALLTERGLRVAAVKRSHHPLPAERPGSDTDRFAEAGAATVAFQAPDGILLRRRSEPALAESLGALGAGHDVVVVEGFRDERIGAAIRLDHLGTARLESEAGEVVLATAGADVVALADALEELWALSVGAAQSASRRGQRRSRPEL